MKQLLVLCAALGVFAVIVTPGRPAPEPAETARASRPAERAARRQSESGALVLRRDSSGQFQLTGQVNGDDVTFLVDTGADVVALTMESAQGLGLDVDPEAFEPIGRTASGIGYGMPVHIDRLEIAGDEFQDVEALVMDGLDTNLLGQSILRRMGRVELRGDQMVIHPAS